MSGYRWCQTLSSACGCRLLLKRDKHVACGYLLVFLDEDLAHDTTEIAANAVFHLHCLHHAYLCAPLAALAVFGRGRIAYQAREPVHPAGDQEAAGSQLFLIERGQGLGQVARALETAGLIRNARALSLMARAIGDEGNLRAGEYEVSAGWSARTILDRITPGRVKPYEIVLPEGSRAPAVPRRPEPRGPARP